MVAILGKSLEHYRNVVLLVMNPFQNGNGEDIGIEIDRFIKESKQLIKEATEL